MKFEIDTTYKTIVLKTAAKLSELKKELKQILGADYDQYTVISDTVYTDKYPFWYQPQPIPVSPYFTTCEGTSSNIIIDTLTDLGASSITCKTDTPFTLTASIN